LLGYFLGAGWRTAERWIGRASAILGGIVLFFLALAWLYRWAVRCEADIRQAWVRFLQRPRMAALRRRFAPQIAFLHARLSPRSYLGLHLTLGALLLIGASWLFGGIAEDVLTGDPLTIVDVRVADWFHAHATPLLTESMLAITNLHGPIAHEHMDGEDGAVLGLETRLVLVNMLGGHCPKRDAAECVDEIYVSPCPSQF
jgi:hypothetical protein